MPHLPISYANTVIYKIVCNDLNIKECYVGHTTNFVQRKRDHKKHCVYENGKRYTNKLYTTIRLNGGWCNYSMVEIEKYPCNDANEATAKEREYYEQLNSGLNTQYPNRSHREWRSNNKGELYLREKIYIENNKEKINEKLCREYVCDCGRVIQHREKTRHYRCKFHTDYTDSVSQAMEYIKR
jgi:hypothetical protein